MKDELEAVTNVDQLRQAAKMLRGEADAPWSLADQGLADALAHWLETTAATVEEFAGNFAGMYRTGDLTETDHAAIVAARAILGGQR